MFFCTQYNRCSAANIRFLIYRHSVLPFLRPRPFPIGRPPVVIGAMGGSGTRVLVPILQLAGYWMGRWICQRTQDSMATRHLLQCEFSQLLRTGEAADARLDALFSRLIQGHRQGMADPEGAWGWKNPRCMWVIPYLARRYPDMRFIHVIRDGRDMALTSNHNLLEKHGAYLLDDPDCRRDSVRAQFRLWAMGNRKAWDDGRRLLGENYLLLDYDRLCRDPKPELRRIYNLLGVPADAALIDRASRLVVPSSGVGRWRKSDHPLLHQPESELREALQLFGYA